MMTMRSIFALLLLSLAAACAPMQAMAEDQSVEITLSRSVCFGFCPAYQVRISGDGAVHYNGERFVNVVGEAHANIPREEVTRLLARFDAIGFTSLREEYRSHVTDLPTYVVTLTRNGRTKRVLDYAGTSVGMPQAMRALQDEIDRVAGTARWVLRDGEPVRAMPER